MTISVDTIPVLGSIRELGKNYFAWNSHRLDPLGPSLYGSL
jgi:hypothetical protein